MGLERRGYVALLDEPLNPERLAEILENWLSRFESVEQLTSVEGAKVAAAAFPIRSMKDVRWEKDLQFRVLAGEQFAWVYLTADRRIIESDGLVGTGGGILSRDLFTEIPFCERVVSDRDDETLDSWEAKGLM